MCALVALLLVPLLLWLGQSVLLWRSGQPIRLRLGTAGLPPAAKRAGRVFTNVVFAAVLLGYPLLRGRSPVAYYGQFLPLGPRPAEMLYGVAAAVLYLALLYLAWLLTDQVQFEVRSPPGRAVRRLLGAPFTALLVAFVEELLFRAMLLADLLESFDPRLALPLGVLVFAAAHYVRRVKRYWTFPGHVALGTLFCVAFFATRALWLPIGLHAGGVLVLMGVRPLIRYTGPAWLVGASIFPYAGVVGIAALLLLVLNIWHTFGGGL